MDQKEKRERKGEQRYIRREKTKNFATTFCGKYERYTVTRIIPVVFLINNNKASKTSPICFFVLLEISLKTEEFHKTEFRGTKIYGYLESTVTVRTYVGTGMEARL